jgi:hypothetical protein
MLKRTVWTAVGYGAGLATSIYVQRRVKRVVRRVAPPEVRDVVGARGSEMVERARQIGVTLRVAAREGRAAMRDTERELRREHPLPARALERR